MNYCRELNLPEPLTDRSFNRLVEDKRDNIEGQYLANNVQSSGYIHITTDTSIFRPELLEIFKSLGLKPNATIMFGNVDRVNYIDSEHIIHADLVYHNNGWVKQPFAINWELTDSEVDFHWWDTGDTPECYPPSTEIPRLYDPRFLYTRGVHYNKREKFEVLPHYKIFERYVLMKSQAVAIKTSVPHSVIRKINTQPRSGLSIRFPLEQIPSWEHGLELFRDYI